MHVSYFQVLVIYYSVDHFAVIYTNVMFIFIVGRYFKVCDVKYV